MATTPPSSDKLPRGADTPPPGRLADDDHLLGELAGYDDQGTDLMPMPEGVLDDLPPPSAAASSWLGKESLASNESDVIRGLSMQPPLPGSSNIFDTGPDGSSRFTTPSGGTDELTGDQPRPSNDVLYADLAAPAEPSSVVFGGDDLFDRPDVRAVLRPADDADKLPGDDRSGSGRSRPTFEETDHGVDGSNLFADPTSADLDLDGSEAVPIGDPHTDADLSRTGPGSSIFAGDLKSHTSGLDVDQIPIMASADEGRFEQLPFDAPPPSGVGTDIFGSAGKPLRPSGVGAVAFDLPHGPDPDATEQSGGNVDMDIPDSPARGGPESSQRSRRIVADDVDGLPSAVFPGLKAAIRKSPAITGLAPIPLPEPARASRRGPLLAGAGGLAAGAGATVAALVLGGFVGGDAPAPKPQPPQQAAVTPAATDAGQVEAVRKEAEADLKRLGDQLAAATRKTNDLSAELQKARLPNPELATTQKRLLDALADADAAKKEAATATGRLKGTSDALAEATAKRQTAEAAVAGVVGAMRDNKLADEGEAPAAALAKLPAALKAATSADGQKAAALAAELAEARKTADAAIASEKAAQATADERAKTLAAAAVAKANEELEAARGREAALKQQVAQAQQAAEAVRTRLEEGFARQLTDARNGITVPLTSAELQARDAAAADLGRGMTAFFAGRFGDAQTALQAAVARNPGDARSWYFLGLAKRRNGDGYGAEAAFRQGAELERRGRSVRKLVDDALVNVQGTERELLRTYRP